MYFDEEIIDIGDWCPLDDRPLEAPPRRVPEPVSKGNLLQVPQFLRYASLDFLMDEFLSLNSIENHQVPSEEEKQDLLETVENQIEGLQFEPLTPFFPMLPQPIEQTQNQEVEEEGNKIFNNMPGFLISALQSFQDQLESHDFGSTKIGIVEKVKRCSQDMIEQILMRLSSKQGNREQLRMVFNDLSGKFYDALKKKSTNNKVIRKYFQLEEKYGAEVMAESKCELREFFCKVMQKEWMHYHSQNRKFGGNNVEMKKKVFYKYLVNFTQEIYDGEIQPLINREKVLKIELFQN